MNVTFVTTTGITAGFRHWPEAVQARALVRRGHAVSALTYFEAGSPLIGQAANQLTQARAGVGGDSTATMVEQA